MSAAFNAIFTPTGGSATTLFDISAGWGESILENPGDGRALEEVVPMFQAANPLRLLLGNVQGQVILSAAKSWTDAPTAIADYKTKRALIGTQGMLVITADTGTLTYAGANFLSVVPAKIIRARWLLRFTFGITTLT